MAWNPMMVILGVLLVALFFVVVPMFAIGLTSFRRRRMVRCPVTSQDASVEVSKTSAALSEFQREPKLRLVDCSLWPGHEDCGQTCVKPETADRAS